MKTNQKLWYDRPASEWVEALPIGNGRFGGMVFGGVKRERIQLNEDTVWSGEPRDTINYSAKHHLAHARKLIFDKKYKEAEAYIEEHMQGTYNQTYEPLGDLELSFSGDAEADDYMRELDLNEAISRVSYKQNGNSILRESFVSAVDQVMVIRLKSDSKISFTAALTSPMQYAAKRVNESRIAISGRCPIHTEPNVVKSNEPFVYRENRGIGFEVQLQVIAADGKIEVSGSRMQVSGKGEILLLVAAATSFNGFDKDPYLEGKDPEKLCHEWLFKAMQHDYDTLKQRHINDYKALFDRVSIDLGGAERAEMPTDQRIEAVKNGAEDPDLAALFFQYGRYLLISSSRPGTQPANLQGIWNDKMRPPWCSSWTTNINIEMNYWLAEPTNLAECHEPLFDMLKELSVTGSRVASEHYNARGWTTHHNTDVWRMATPAVGSPSWAFWPMAGAWMCQHIWEHYDFSRDEKFLAEAYPTLKGAALFCLDFLVEDEDGYLVTAPSTSPENTFIDEHGNHSSVTKGASMDMQLIRDLFSHCIQASNVLGIDDLFRKELEEAMERLLPLKIGKHGQIQEWDEDFDEAEPGHRHTAHMFALHPGDYITVHDQPELAEAARKTLERRMAHGGGHTGWACAWNVNFYARLLDGEQSHHYLNELLGGLHPNLTNAHRHPKIKMTIFQIDGSMGGVSGITEMLLQSHGSAIELLPALPKKWQTGSIKGLRARGGYEIDMEWQDGKLQKAVIRATVDGICKLRLPDTVRIVNGGAEQEIETVSNGVIQFNSKAGEVYEVITQV